MLFSFIASNSENFLTNYPPTHNFIVRKVYVRWWEKYTLPEKDYPKIMTNCNPQKIQDPQAQTQFLLHKSRNH